MEEICPLLLNVRQSLNLNAPIIRSLFLRRDSRLLFAVRRIANLDNMLLHIVICNGKSRLLFSSCSHINAAA